MKNKGFLFIITCLFLFNVAVGQTEKDEIILKAMTEELERNFKGLTLNGVSPCFLEYVIQEMNYSYISAALGSTLSMVDHQKENLAGVRLVLGTKELSSEVSYAPRFYGGTLAENLEADNIKRVFWKTTDYAFKREFEAYEKKKAFLESNPKSEEEQGVLDFTELGEVKNVMETSPVINFEVKEWEPVIKELSEIFKNYPTLFATSVEISCIDKVFYVKTSDGVSSRTPLTYIQVMAKASTRTKEDVVVSDQWFTFVPVLEDLPSREELKKAVNEFAKRLTSFNNTICMEEPYEGPVLFVGEAAREMFRFNSVGIWAAISNRPGVGAERQPGWHGCMGERVINKDVSVRNYTQMKVYNGEKVYGGYSIDAEGVVPTEGIVLIENGVLKNRLNDRIPDVEDPRSTGSARFTIGVGGINQRIAPGIVHVTVNKTKKEAEMKQLLLATAKKQGLKYAYIFVQPSRVLYVPYIYRVDVETGEEVLVSNAQLNYAITLQDDNVQAFSDFEKVDNCLFGNAIVSTYIYPHSVLFKKLRIDIVPVKEAKNIFTE